MATGDEPPHVSSSLPNPFPIPSHSDVKLSTPPPISSYELKKCGVYSKKLSGSPKLSKMSDLSGSLWLSLRLTLAHSCSILLSLAHSGSGLVCKSPNDWSFVDLNEVTLVCEDTSSVPTSAVDS